MTALRSSSSCSLRCIKSPFNILFFGMKTGWGRFGAGIYTTATLSKFVQYLLSVLGLLFNSFCRLDSYLRNRCTSDWKAVLLNTVSGKGYKTTINKPTLTKPPTGYDSMSVVTLWFFGGTLMGRRVILGGSRGSIELRRARGI